MSDFLNNLVVRSFGLGEVIRSRVPSLFEPQPGSAMPVTPPSYGEEGFAAAPVSAERAGTAHAPVARRFGGMTVPQETEPVLSMRQTAADEADSMRELGLGRRLAEGYSSLSPAGFKPRPLETEPQAISSAIRPKHAVSVRTALPFVQPQVTRASFNEDVLKSQRETDPSATQTAISEPERVAAMTESGAPANQRAAASRSTASASVHGPVGSSHLFRTAELLRPQSSPVPPTRTPIQAAKLSMPSQVTPYRDQTRPGASWQKAESEPTIQVTIGRIEVRAEQLSARLPTKERLAPQAMSLDEYLRRRAGRSGE